MKSDELLNAIGEAKDEYVQDVRNAKVKKMPGWAKWTSAIAASLALTLVLVIFFAPARVSAKEVSIPSASRLSGDEVTDYTTQSNQSPKDSFAILADFTGTCSTKALSGTDDTNRIWSPVSAYISLSIAAELSEGQTHQELMTVLNATDIDTLRQRISVIWERLSREDINGEVCLFNSLWLDESLSYDQEGMDQVSYHYYASVLQRDLGSSAAKKVVSNWVQNQTDGKLSYDGSIGTDPNNALALISSLYFKSDWKCEFDSTHNTRRTFHGNSEDFSTTFMYQNFYQHDYFWDDDFAATALWTENNARIWLILPDEDKTVDQVLSSGAYIDMITSDSESPWENQAPTNVHLYLPKFEITSTVDLKDTLKSLGVQKIFDPSGGDFSKSLESRLPIFLTGLTQSTRVELNEHGVIATGFTEFNFGFGASGPHDYVEMIFDRPFIFVIDYLGVPLFVGVVNHP